MKIPKQVETKTFCLQDKSFPRQSNFKSIICHDMSWKKLVLQIYILQKGNLFWYFYLGINILGILFLAKIYVGNCCLGWYIMLESNLQKSCLSWHLLGKVTLHLRVVKVNDPNQQKMSGPTKLLTLETF